MASQPMPDLAASAMNALAHAVESLYGPMRSPVTSMAALRAVELFESGLGDEEPRRDDLALASILAGYAVGCAGFAVHHAVCQTTVRVLGTPHAQTNAVMLPHSAAFVAERDPAALQGVDPAATRAARRPRGGNQARRVGRDGGPARRNRRGRAPAPGDRKHARRAADRGRVARVARSGALSSRTFVQKPQLLPLFAP